LLIRKDEPLGRAVVGAIQHGDLATLERLLDENRGLANARIASACRSGQETRTLLHIATDWPGRFPNAARTVAVLLDAGADVNARFSGSHGETPLHWAASSDDVEVLDALLDRGADIEAPGAVIGGGTPLADAVAFGQWKAARRLVERGATTTLWQAAALGLMERLKGFFATGPGPAQEEVTKAFWCACHGGQRDSAEYLLGRGADINWIGFDHLTPLDAAERSSAGEVVQWLRAHGARTAGELR
jgi:ankyrin repeat protein